MLLQNPFSGNRKHFNESNGEYVVLWVHPLRLKIYISAQLFKTYNDWDA